PAPPLFFSLSLHDALPIYPRGVLLVVGVRLPRPPPCLRSSSDLPIGRVGDVWKGSAVMVAFAMHHGSTGGRVFRALCVGCRLERSEEHTSELQSRSDLVCR